MDQSVWHSFPLLPLLVNLKPRESNAFTSAEFYCSFLLDYLCKQTRASGKPTPESSAKGDYNCVLSSQRLRACASSSLSREQSADRLNLLYLDFGALSSFLFAELHLTGGAELIEICGEHILSSLRGKLRSGENASCTDCGAMAHDGTSAAGDRGNGR